MNGISFAVIVGYPVWPKVQISAHMWRFVFGPVAVWVLFKDLEVWLADLVCSIKDERTRSRRVPKEGVK